MLTSRKIGGGPACCARAGSANSPIIVVKAAMKTVTKAALKSRAVFFALIVSRSLLAQVFPRSQIFRRLVRWVRQEILFEAAIPLHARWVHALFHCHDFPRNTILAIVFARHEISADPGAG